MSYCQNCADKEREVERLKGEVDEVARQWRGLHEYELKNLAAYQDKLIAAEAEAQKLREALTKYGQCLSTCATQGQYYPARFNMNYCDCGLRKALGGS